VNKLLLNLYVRFQKFVNREEGQDLVEYALLVALIALAAVSGTKEVASAVNTAFSKVSNTLG
jgi:pilus assembly protein Flp/PilA